MQQGNTDPVLFVTIQTVIIMHASILITVYTAAHELFFLLIGVHSDIIFLIKKNNYYKDSIPFAIDWDKKILHDE